MPVQARRTSPLPKTVRVAIPLSPSLHRRLKIAAALRDITLRDLLTQIAEQEAVGVKLPASVEAELRWKRA